MVVKLPPRIAESQSSSCIYLCDCSTYGMRNTVKGYLCPDITSGFEFSMGLVKLIRLSSLNFTYLSDTVIQCEYHMNFVMVN